MKYYYVYILASEGCEGRFYVGYTEDVEERLAAHNEGRCPNTRPYRPWRIKTVIQFTDMKRAKAFERYLKTSSGIAFARKRLREA